MTVSRPPFHNDILTLDAESTTDQITHNLRHDILNVLRKRGAVVGISGGIDSSVSLALAVRALGADRVLGIMMPDRDSSPESLELAQELAGAFDVKIVLEDLTAALEGLGCYYRRDSAVGRVFPDFDPQQDKYKISLPQNILNGDRLSVFSLTVISADGSTHSKRLPPDEFLQIVAATNFKQRSRMSMLYYHAERRNYAAVGTTNKHEYEQGFFVKFGDSSCDVAPIIHLYKTQIYQLAQHLGVPDTIIQRTPSADTYSAHISQEEFFFQLPFELMDLLWFGYENGYEPGGVAPALNLTEEQVARAFNHFDRKKRTTDYLRMAPIRYQVK